MSRYFSEKLLTRDPILARYIILLAPVAQLDRAPGFEPVGRRFESCRARHGAIPNIQGPVAQLAEQLTLNQLVGSSNPPRPTNRIKGLTVLDCKPFLFTPSFVQLLSSFPVGNRLPYTRKKPHTQGEKVIRQLL